MTRAKPQEKKSLTLRIGEYMAGTTVEEFAKWKYKNSSKQKKSSACRDVIKLEITTDDETEADTLKLTYPRSGRSVFPATRNAKATPKSTAAPAIESDSESESASASEPEATVKKVRFETVTKPRKSALKKKGRKLESDSSDNTSSTSRSSRVSYSSDASSSESSSSSSKKDKKRKKKSTSSTPEASSQDTETELKVECNCPKCQRKQMKLRLRNMKKKKAQESDSEASQSEAEIPPKAKRPKQPKKVKKSQFADTDSGAELSSSAPDAETETETSTLTGSETETPSEAKEEKPAKNKNVKADKQQNKSAKQANSGASKQAEGKKAQRDKVKDKKKQEKQEKQEPREVAKKRDYPEAAVLSPHARRPYLTEPIRAEVVQMERVIEGPEDPYPNAYYDPEHGIMRYYQGPVYGSRGSQPLYPKRDPNFKPLPIGVPHPSRNPYYNGFKEQDASHIMYGQGAGPSHVPAGYPPAPHGYGPPYHARDHGAEEDTRKKSNYVMSGANGKATFRNKDGAGYDNGPKLGQNNPYYNNRRSRFSVYGSNISATGQHCSPKHSNSAGGWAPPGSPMRDNWVTGSRHGSQCGGGAGKPPSHSEWDADQNKTQGTSGYVSAWDATANSDHGNNNQAPGRTGSNDSWGQAQPAGGNGAWSSPAKGAASPQFDNVAQAMPGSWMPDTQYTSNWGDNTMAASTGGAVDQPGGEWESKPADPVW